MTVMYATVAEFSLYLHQTVDTPSATLALQVTSELFAKRSHTRFESTAATYSQPGVNAFEIVLPFQPLIAVSQVRITPFNGASYSPATIVTDYAIIGPAVYRRLGFGSWWRFPPDLVEIDYTHGYTVVPDDVKGAVLESAAAAYMSPDITVKSESIDDYSMSSAANSGGFMLSPAAQALADFYAGVLVA
jgi:hypothetical protein